MRAKHLIALLSFLFILVGCPEGDPEDDDNTVCAPGETQPCTCAGGGSGAQVCEEDGSGWGTCDCGSGDDDTAGDDDTMGDDDDTGDDDTGDDDDSGDECADAEPCGGESYLVVDSFDVDAAAQCESVAGNLTIDCGLTSIDLPCLTSVDGRLDIFDNGTLTSLDMPVLTSVGGALYIGWNPALTSLDGLSSLTSVGGYLYIQLNDCLDQAEAEVFAASLDVWGDVTVEDNGVNHPCN